MDWNQGSFTLLSELYPQVDVKTIQTTVLDHGDDLESAINFLASEVVSCGVVCNQGSNGTDTLPPTSSICNGGLASELKEFGSPPQSSECEEPEMDCNGHKEFILWLSEIGTCQQANLPISSNDTIWQPSVNKLDCSPTATQKERSFCEGVCSSRPDYIPQDNKVVPKRCTTSGVVDTGSNHNISIELLDEAIQEARADKEYLINVLEDIHMLQLKVDQEKSAAQIAKANADKAGLDTLKKAEDMKQAFAQAQEAHEMRAGEVYGERAVLATEAQELELRLVQLKGENSKVIAALNEIRAGLHAQYESAAKEREAAEEEKRLKETSAQKVLAMEETLMAKAAQELRDVEAEAEACARLRDFLVQRGSIVDSLQEEIASLRKCVGFFKKQIEEGELPAINGNSSMTSLLEIVVKAPCDSEGALSASNGNSTMNSLSEIVIKGPCNPTSQELPQLFPGEIQFLSQTSRCVFPSVQVDDQLGVSAPSELSSMRSAVSASLSCQSSDGSVSVQSDLGLDCAVESINCHADTSLVRVKKNVESLVNSAISTDYFSLEDCDTETGSHKGGIEIVHFNCQPDDLNNDNLSMLTPANTAKKSSFFDDDDGDWHLLNIFSKKNQPSSEISSVSFGGTQLMEKIIWETT
eukprot:c23760_g1_i1 orf=477-2393(+)